MDRNYLVGEPARNVGAHHEECVLHHIHGSVVQHFLLHKLHAQLTNSASRAAVQLK